MAIDNVENGTTYTLTFDKWHFRLVAYFGGFIAAVVVGLNGFLVERLLHHAAEGRDRSQKISRLEGQVHTLLENVQHAGD